MLNYFIKYLLHYNLLERKGNIKANDLAYVQLESRAWALGWYAGALPLKHIALAGDRYKWGLRDSQSPGYWDLLNHGKVAGVYFK